MSSPAPDLEPRGTGPEGRVALHAALVTLALALCWAGALDGPFVFDDPRPGVPVGRFTRRLVWDSFLLNRALSGGATWSYHLLNVLVHAACALVLLGVMRRALALAVPGRPAAERARTALAVTLLWAVHPLQTSVVTYISQRAESMAALCYLGTLYGFLRALDGRRPRAWLLLSVASLALGFLCKEIIATAPLVVLLAERTLAGRAAGGPRGRWRYHLLLWGVAAAMFWTFIAHRLVAENASSGFGEHEAFGPLEYARTQPAVILHYLRLVFWPSPLVFDYAWPVAERPGEWLPQTLALAVLGAAAVALVVRRSPLGLPAAAFFLVLGPTSSIVPIKDVAFEHRMYLPLACVLVLAAEGVRAAARRLAPRPGTVAAGLTVAAALACAALTVRRNRDYSTAEALWSSVVRHAPDNPRGHNNLAAALIDEGRMDEAEPHARRALELDPEWASAHRNLGVIAADRARFPEAVEHLRRSLALRDSAPVRADLALLLDAMGRGDEALAELRAAVALDDVRAGDCLTLARRLLSAGATPEDRREALGLARRAAELDPARRAEALEVEGIAHLGLGDLAAGRAALRAALEAARDEPLRARVRERLDALPPGDDRADGDRVEGG